MFTFIYFKIDINYGKGIDLINLKKYEDAVECFNKVIYLDRSK